MKVMNESINHDYLIGEQTLLLHTKIAQSLFSGEWKHGRLGLLQYAKLIKNLWYAVKMDDPYAEWFLLKSYDQIENAKEQLQNYEDVFQAQLDNLRGFQVELFRNPHPVLESLQFATPFAYMGAKLVEQFDYVNRQLFTMRRIGVIPKGNLRHIKLIQQVQKTFRIPLNWHSTGVTRKDIVENNDKAEKARKLMGEMPRRILHKDIEFNFLPKLQIM